MVVNKKYLHIEIGAKAGKGSIVGYKPLREIKKLDLCIGENLVTMSGCVIYAGTRIGKNAIVGHNCVIREENVIGDNFYLWSNSIVDYGCRIGNNVKIHCNVYVAQFTEIGDEVFIAPGVIIANDLHPKCKFSKKCMRGPSIKRGVVIGANATINPFVVIGERAVIGAGSVVTKDVPAGKVAYGNPARVRGDASDVRCVKGLTDYPYKQK